MTTEKPVLSIALGTILGIFTFVFSLLFVPVLEAKDLDDLIKIYGSLRPEIIGRFPETGDHVRRMDDGYSRVGVKGRAELSDNLSGFYKYERRVSANDGAVRQDNSESPRAKRGASQRKIRFRGLAAPYDPR